MTPPPPSQADPAQATPAPSPRATPGPAPVFARWAWAFLAYLVGVVLFGAWVRITHSGAGCGAHWPTCNGDIVPFAPSVETLIEYSHRLTSGLLGIFGVALLVAAARRFGRSRVTRAAIVTMMFIVFEALLGAGLVLQELVTDNDSVARAAVVALHLANTLTLAAAAALVPWWAQDTRPLQARVRSSGLLGLAVLALVLTAMTGAVTALGDTLFPVQPTGGVDLLERVRDDLGAANHFLVRLRIIHPIVAVLSAALVMAVPEWVEARTADGTTLRLARGLRHAAALEVVLGGLNIWLAAPGWLQIVHLAAAQVLWIAAIVTTASFLAAEPRPRLAS